MSTDGDIYEAPLNIAAKYAQAWLDNGPDRGINPEMNIDQMRAIFGGPVPQGPTNPVEVIERMAKFAEPGLMNMPSGRFFGWVIGGTLPAALGADWLVSAWDQNAGMRNTTPAVVAMEEIAGEWIKDILGLPATADVGFPTGATMANFTGLISARHKVLADVGWDVNSKGLNGAPTIRVLVGAERHITIDLALLRWKQMIRGEFESISCQRNSRADLVPPLSVWLPGKFTPVLLIHLKRQLNLPTRKVLGSMSTAPLACGHWPP
jgi:hypothetical protein